MIKKRSIKRFLFLLLAFYIEFLITGSLVKGIITHKTSFMTGWDLSRFLIGIVFSMCFYLRIFSICGILKNKILNPYILYWSCGFLLLYISGTALMSPLIGGGLVILFLIAIQNSPLKIS